MKIVIDLVLAVFILLSLVLCNVEDDKESGDSTNNTEATEMTGETNDRSTEEYSESLILIDF